MPLSPSQVARRCRPLRRGLRRLCRGEPPLLRARRRRANVSTPPSCARSRSVDRRFHPGLLRCGRWLGQPVRIAGLHRRHAALRHQPRRADRRQPFASLRRGRTQEHFGEPAAELGPVERLGGKPQSAVSPTHTSTGCGQLGGGADRVIDKLPDNVFKLGVIATLYPAARIIFCQRDPRDIGAVLLFPEILRRADDIFVRSRQLRPVHSRDRAPSLRIGIVCCRCAALTSSTSRSLPILRARAGGSSNFLVSRGSPLASISIVPSAPCRPRAHGKCANPSTDRSVGRWRHYERHLGPLLRELAITN